MVFVESGSLSSDRNGSETSTLSFQVYDNRWGTLPPQFRGGDVVAGRFRVRRFLGQGGAAQVYEAEDLELGQSVAIKVLRPDVAAGARAARWLKTEVLMARGITHPNVCRIYDVFQHLEAGGDRDPASVLVVAMELLRGETLAARLRRGPLSAAEALPLVRQLAEGLAAAHAAGVAHLDLKSANVMLAPGRDGVRAVISDFGLAQKTDPRDEAGSAGSTCARRGTPAYMAPEQVAGRGVTTAADLYSFGLVVYEMVTGRLPFRGETPQATAEQRLSQPPPSPRAYAPDLDPAWERAILRCLERDPDRRFGSATEFVAALSQPAAVAPAELPFEWRRVTLVCLLLSLLAALGFFLPAHLSGGTPFHRKMDAAAWNLYERGLEALRASEALTASRHLERAVATDPSFCLAHSALADAWMELGYQKKARQQSLRAFELIGDLPRKERLWVEARYYELQGQLDSALQRYEALWTFFPGNLEYGLRLASAQLYTGHSQESLATLAALRSSGSASTDPRIDLAEAQAAAALSDLRQQLAAAQRGASRAAALGRWRLLAHGWLLEGQALRELRKLDQARAVQEAALALSMRQRDRLGTSDALYELGVTRHYALQYTEAEQMVGKALAGYRRAGIRYGEATALRRLALIVWEADRREESLPKLAAALAIFREIGDPIGEDRTRMNLAMLLQSQGRLAESAQHFESSLALIRAFGNRREEAYRLMKLADCVQHWELVESLRLLRQAQTICEQIENALCWSQVAPRLGAALGEAGDLASAEKVLTEAWRRLPALGSGEPQDYARIWLQLRLAKLHLDQGRLEAAATQASAVIRHFDPNQPRLRTGFAWTLLTASLEAQGRRKEAEHALARAQALLPTSFKLEDAVFSMILQARLLNELGRPEDAAAVLARAEAQATAMGSDSLRIEAAIVRELITPNPKEECGPFIALQAEAKARHFGLLATKAARALQDCKKSL